MATPLRYALIFLLWAMVAVIYAPLIPAALTLISPALSLTHWQALFADPQLPQALLATLVSTTIAAVGALLIALLVIVALWPWPKWQRMCARLPWLLAIPHVAFATSALLLFAEGGLLYDYFPYFTPLMDKLGIGLGLTLAVKESAFLLWILAAVLSEKRLLQQVIVLDSLGYSRWQCLNWLLLPSVAPALAMAMLATFIALLLLLLWLEWGPQRRQLWLWLPILLPALPLVAGQYTLALWLNLDGSWTAVVWGHLLWVMPWMLFILQPAWQRIDSRLILIAQTLSWSRAKIFFYVKCPLMLRPTLIAFAVGFSVSIAQYMPTLWLGAGRFPTLTTEAVALSSGGSNGIFAAQALWQLLLPLIIFALTALVAKWVGYVRQGLR
ncbi:TPA: ABC transporter permease subunit [Escherichia coli]|nr:ABC transporter permease subunit [Escherichia coli]HAN8832642.1 ABC transporter permease subunit [Escherichia coli]HAN8861547.1 ABC transporter permease subunit [Escherichia coli]